MTLRTRQRRLSLAAPVIINGPSEGEAVGEADMLDFKMLLSRDEIAKLLALTPRRISQLAESGIIPKPMRGRYPLGASVAGFISHLREQRLNAPSAIKNEAIAAPTAYVKVKTQLAEMEAKLRAGELVPLHRDYDSFIGLEMAPGLGKRGPSWRGLFRL